MRTPPRLGLWMFLVAWGAASQSAAVTINGSSLALRSDGTPSGSNYTLTSNGYVGTYITLASPASVTVDVQASGTSGPQMDVVIGDAKATYNVTSGTYSHVFSLPAGTHFLRTQLSNDPGVAGRQLTVASVSVSGASFSNTNDNTNALAASDTYIANYRRGPASIKLPFAPGTQVGVSLKRLAFDWGGGVHEDPIGGLLDPSNPDKLMYQTKLAQNFNEIATAGSGDWWGNEPTRGQTELTGMLQTRDFAVAHNMHTRLHSLIWEENQPNWVQSLKNNSVGSSSAKADLSNAITNRIGYYYGLNYNEVDVYNESWHGALGSNNTFWNLYGASGIAKIYHDSQVANPATKAFVNDYQVLQGSSNTFGAHVDSLIQAGQAAGYGNVVGAIGLQYYSGTPDPNAAAAMKYGLENMNVRGLPTAMTEFGTYTGTSASSSATLLGQAMRLFFGNPTSTGFVIWDWTKDGTNQFAPGAALYNVNGSTWTITAAGKAWQDALGIQDWDGNTTNGWTTQLTSTVGADGTINFTGYYGDYQLTVGSQVYKLTIAKGTPNYSVGFPTGDLNYDGKVNAADYVSWRKSDSSAGNYNLWRANFSVGPAASGDWLTNGIPTPEPSTIVLVATGILLYLSRR